MLEPAAEFEPLFTDPIDFGLPAENPLAGRPELRWSGLKGGALTFPARGAVNRLLTDEALTRSRTRIHWTHEVCRSCTALDLVPVGVAPLPRSALLANASRAVVVRPVSALVVAHPIGLLTRFKQRTSLATGGWIAAFREAAADFDWTGRFARPFRRSGNMDEGVEDDRAIAFRPDQQRIDLGFADGSGKSKAGEVCDRLGGCL